MILGLIGDMYGPYFLVFYLLTIVGGYILIRNLFGAIDLLAPGKNLNTGPDHYDLAMMNGGMREVLMMAVFSLKERGLVNIKLEKKTGSLFYKANKPIPPDLHWVEENVLAIIKSKAKPLRDFFNAKSVIAKVEGFLTERESELQQSGYLWSKSYRAGFRSLGKLVSVVVIALGIYKMIYAANHGHSNVLILIILIMFGGLLLWVTKLSGTRRKHRKLKRELGNQTGERLKESLAENELNDNLLVLGIFGFGLMEELAWNNEFYSEMQTIVPSGHAGGWGGSGCSGCSSCSGGCGSSCGSSCGGGCGGCS